MRRWRSRPGLRAGAGRRPDRARRVHARVRDAGPLGRRLASGADADDRDAADAAGHRRARFEFVEPIAEAPAPVPAQSTQPMPVGEPPAPGFVSAVSLGELEAPEIPDDVDLVEPSEFSLPRFEALGEREDDIDIEEID